MDEIKDVLMRNDFLVKVFCLALLSSNVMYVQAQNNAGVAATVNGSKIYTKDLDLMVKNVTASGAKDSPELRNNILSDLVVREAILQDVKKTNLEKQGDNATRVKIAQQNILMDLWFADYIKSHPITDKDLHAEYDHQASLTKEGKNSNEYRISQIVVASEADADDILTKISNGASFSALAKEKSLDKQSGANGGEIGNWVLPDQVLPPMGDTIASLSKGKVATKTVKTNLGWHVLRVDDIRKFKLPSFEESKGVLSQTLANQRKQTAVSELMKRTTVVPVK